MYEIAITGGNGFVGKALLASLDAKGYQTYSFDRVMKEGLPEWDVKPAQVIIHTAARVHVMKETDSDPLTAFRRSNVEGTLRLARQALEAGTKRFVYVSSIKVNGDATTGKPFTSFDDPNPIGPYAISKWEAEQELLKLSRVSELEVVIVRPPLVYGPNVQGNFAQLVKILSHGIPLPLANINNSRSLIYLGNLVDALTTCAIHPAAAGKTFLVSDGKNVSTPDLLRELAFAINRPARLFPCPHGLLKFCGYVLGKPDHIDRLLDSLCIDSTEIHDELDWSPSFSLQQGLHATAESLNR